MTFGGQFRQPEWIYSCYSAGIVLISTHQQLIEMMQSGFPPEALKMDASAHSDCLSKTCYSKYT